MSWGAALGALEAVRCRRRWYFGLVDNRAVNFDIDTAVASIGGGPEGDEGHEPVGEVEGTLAGGSRYLWGVVVVVRFRVAVLWPSYQGEERRMTHEGKQTRDRRVHWMCLDTSSMGSKAVLQASDLLTLCQNERVPVGVFCQQVLEPFDGLLELAGLLLELQRWL